LSREGCPPRPSVARKRDTSPHVLLPWITARYDPADVRRAIAGTILWKGDDARDNTADVLRGRALAIGWVSFAQQPETVRVRGTIEAVDGAMLTVKSRDNQTFYKVRVSGDAVVRGLVQASLAEIKDNTFIGVSGLPQPDGSQKALEIHIFPEAMRGTGEGHQPWDLVPNSTMTNAAVAQMVKAVDGDEITVKYKGGEKKIIVLPQTRIVTFVPGDKSELKPGVKIFIAAARKKDDGTLEAGSIAAGRDGLPPPM
jgi:hypothetical protein